MGCPTETPACKRKMMVDNDQFVKKQCPLNIKPKCLLNPQSCPLLSEEDDKCGYAKLINKDGNVNVDECPCKTCFLSTGCPLSSNPSPTLNNDINNVESQWPDKIPPCLICPSTEKKMIDTQITVDGYEKQQLDKQPSVRPRNNNLVAKCPLTSNPRPIPCSDCLLQELGGDCEGDRVRACPYLLLADMCSEKCNCDEVPNIKTGALCPFMPKPCSCCAKPQCPLSRTVDCVIQPKPSCQLLAPKKCSCAKSCPKIPACLCGVCNICSSLCNPCCSGPPSCPLNPNPCSPKGICCCGKCPISCLPPSCCPPCFPPSSSCPLAVTCCPPCVPSLTSCPLSGTCCPPCAPPSSSCPLAGTCCPCDTKCGSPSCIPCLLKSVQSILNPCICPPEPTCPLVPPPCNLKKQTDLNLKTIDDKENEDRTFHVPTCPQFKHPCEIHDDNNVKNQLSREQSRTTIRESETKSIKFTENNGILKENKSFLGGNFTKKVQCPLSPACGMVPLPECPAAEILCPELYKKPAKVEKKECPFKKCMKKKDCMLSQLQPKVDCPLSKVSNCPLTAEPDCPMEELMSKCPLSPKCLCSCACPIPPACCNTCTCSQNPCDGPYTSNDGCSRTANNACFDRKHNFVNTGSEGVESSASLFTFTTMSQNNDYQSSDNSKNRDLFSLALEVSSSNFNSSGDKRLSVIEFNKFDGAKYKDNLIRDSNSECPFESLAPKKKKCPIAPPKCPLTPKTNTTCPLTRKPDPCCLSKNGELVCPVQYPPCKKFPKGRCPMGDINACDCEYPISPCLLPLQDPNTLAPPQYCFKEDCCMGLSLPPVLLEEEYEKGPYYQFQYTKPGREETKHYIKVFKERPEEIEVSLLGKTKERVHDNWTVIKNGEGYLRCKSIAKKLEEMGPLENIKSQYDTEDCPIDEETRLVLENRKKHLKEEKKIEILRNNLGLNKKLK